MKGQNDYRNGKNIVTSWWNKLTPDVKKMTLSMVICCVACFACNVCLEPDATIFDVIFHSFFSGIIFGTIVFVILRHIGNEK